ncbi:hypothetical protein [Streptomyces sp. NPDC096153]|uniref:COG4315 family predicted lipoprotein n=1 Tax=Streptomyces sp. NPDC096153 TaxID=3155548 RepID=UPI003326F656
MQFKRIFGHFFILAATFSLSACVSDKGSSGEDGADELLVPGPYASAPHRPIGAVGAGEVKIGKIAVNESGLTLYVFSKDSASRSECSEQCAKKWPPLLTENGMPVAFPGIDGADLGVAKRKDGGKQITLNGKPLYRYSGDTEPGQYSGHNVDPSWHVVNSKGDLIK